MKLPLAYYGDPILRKKASPVTEINDAVRKLVADMTDTVLAHNGIGLAAPQVHHSLRIFITCIPEEGEDGEEKWPGELRVYINPKLSNLGQELVSMEEGCLSIPVLRADVIRPDSVTIEAMDLEGNTFTEEATGLQARCFMHENDHINGVLYIDRLSPKEKHLLEPRLREIKKKYYS